MFCPSFSFTSLASSETSAFLFSPLRTTRTITLNGKRSIGRPQARSRTRRDSLDDSLDGSDNENGNAETKNDEDNNYDVDMEEESGDVEFPDDDGRIKTPFTFYCYDFRFVTEVWRSRESTSNLHYSCRSFPQS